MTIKEMYYRNRWFALGLLALVINGWAVMRKGEIRGGKGYAAEGDIVLLTPAAGKPILPTEPLEIRFPTPMIEPELIGTWQESGPMNIQPLMMGQWYWKTDDHALFMPEKDWRSGMEYQLVLHGSLRDTQGQRVKAFHTSIRTDALRCLSVEQTDFNSKHQATLRILFNHAPDKASLKKHLSLALPNSRNGLRYDLLSGSVPEEFILQTDPVSTPSFTVQVQPGVHSLDGKIDLAIAFTKHLQFADTMRLTRTAATTQAFQPSALQLRFSSPPDRARLREYITIEPTCSYSYQVEGCEVTLQGDFVPTQSYQLRIREGLPAMNGTKLLAAVDKRVYFPEVEPTLALREGGRYLSPRGHMQLPVDSMNVSSIQAEAYRVYPNNLIYFVNRYSKYSSAYRSLSHLIAEQRVAVKAVPNQSVRTPIELKDLLQDHGTGVYMIGLTSDDGLDDRQLVVVTDIGITLKRSEQDLLVWANQIHDLTPIDQGEVKVYSQKNQLLYTGKTADDGIARIRLERQDDEAIPYLVTVQKGDDISWLGFNDTYVNGLANQGSRAFVEQGYEAFVFTDRGIYRPGETIHVKTILRGKDLACPEPFPVRLKVIRPDGRLWREWTEILSPFGSAGLDVTLDEYLPTGRFALECTLPGDDQVIGSQTVAVESFVPPQIRVSIDADEKRVPANEQLNFEVQAEHLFGAKAKGLPVTAWVIYRSIPFTPAAWAGYQFGDPTRLGIERRQSGISGELDDEGRFAASEKMNWGSEAPAGALKALIGASVKNMSGRSVIAYGSRIVDPMPYYIGMESEALKKVKLDETLTLPILAVQPDGQLNEDLDSLDLEIYRIFYTRIRDKNQYVSQKRTEIVDEGQVTMQNGHGTWSVHPKAPGEYIIRIKDPVSGVSAAAKFYVSEKAYDYAWKADKPDRLTLELDRENYAAGDTALLTIKAPFTGKALIALEQSGLVNAWTKHLDQNTQTIEIPLLPGYTPNVYCSVTLIREVTSDAEGVYRATGRINIPVIRPEQELQVRIQAEDVRPQGVLRALIDVTQHTGGGAPVEVVLAAVDEGICMLTRHEVADPLAWFRTSRRSGIRQYDQYELLLPELKEEIFGAASTPGGGGSSIYGNRLNPIAARRFKPVALWAGSVVTDAEGHAEVSLNVPEFTGELRLMAVAIHPDGFGRAETSINVGRPVVVQQSLPRFLATGDAFEIPIKVFNRTDAVRSIDYAVHADGPVDILQGLGRIQLAAGAEKMIHLKAQAADRPGKAEIHFQVGAGEEGYAETVELAVRPPFGFMQVSHTGALNPGEELEIRAGENWLPGTAQEQLYCAPRPDVALGGGLGFLLDYPYGCLEQTTSKSFPLLYMNDLLKATRPELADPEELKAYVQSGLYRILGMQRRDGSLSYWPNAEVYHYGSVYAAHFIVEADRLGYDVPAHALCSLLDYLEQQVSRRIQTNEDLTFRSYALYVLALANRVNPGSIGRMTERVNDAPVAARIHIVNALAAAGNRKEAHAMLQTIGLAETLSSPTETKGNLNTPTRDLALLLNAWLDLDPSAPLVAGLAKQLGERRVRGRYYTTQDNAYALLALGKYANRTAGENTSFTARLSDGRTLDQRHRKPMNIKQGMKLQNEGPGMLYYAVHSAGVPTGGDLPDEDHNVRVRRSLFTPDGFEITRNRFAQGEMILVRIEVDPLEHAVDNLVIQDLLPAGFEIEHAGRNLNETIPWLSEVQRPAARSMDVRDDRLLLFPAELNKPVNYFYLARAVTPGEYVWPALEGECMYNAGIRSRNRNMERIEVLHTFSAPKSAAVPFIKTEAAQPFLTQRSRATNNTLQNRPAAVQVNTQFEQAFEYVVQDGENLHDIARAFIVNAEDLRSLNGLAIHDSIGPGDVLSIPPSIF
ncbi:MAG: hypothetical protein ACI9TH_001891 [Kiritimatiellia bacterium]|jgi:uncharacterized protein YfaS (alpha-2-macroglobulin family)